MLTEDTVAQARRRWREEGWSLRAIAAAYGVSYATARRWTSLAAYEQDKASCRAYKRRHREQMAAYDRAYHQRIKIPCPFCGSAMLPTSSRCGDCRKALSEVRESILIGCYQQGWKLNEIAAVLDTTRNALSGAVWKLRKQGRLGYRYRVGPDGLRLPGRR